jgi:transcriptional regulator with XRE-family HTH domain
MAGQVDPGGLPSRREPNSRLREQRRVRRWKQDDVAAGIEDLAQQLGEPMPRITAGLVDKWERGVRRPGRYYGPRLCLLFGLFPQELGLVASPRMLTDCRRLSAELGAERRFPIGVSSEEPASGYVDGIGHVGAMKPPVPEQRKGDVCTDELVHRASVLGEVLLAQVGLPEQESMERLRRVQRKQVRLDSATLDVLAAMTASCRRIDDLQGARTAFPMVIGHLGGVTELLTWAVGPSLRRRLVAIAAEVAQLAGWLAIDMHEHAAARAVLNVSIDAARESDDLALLAFNLGNLSQAHSAAGRPLDALRLLERARAIAVANATPTTRAWLAAVEAQAQASLGDREACWRTLGRADEAMAEPECVEGPAWMYFFNQAQLSHWAGHAHLRCGNAAAARVALGHAYDTLDRSFVRERSVIVADLATVHVVQGDFGKGSQLAGEALELTAVAGSSRAIRRLRDLRSRLDPAVSEQRDLDHQLRLVTGAPS